MVIRMIAPMRSRQKQKKAMIPRETPAAETAWNMDVDDV